MLSACYTYSGLYNILYIIPVPGLCSVASTFYRIHSDTYSWTPQASRPEGIQHGVRSEIRLKPTRCLISKLPITSNCNHNLRLKEKCPKIGNHGKRNSIFFLLLQKPMQKSDKIKPSIFLICSGAEGRKFSIHSHFRLRMNNLNWMLH